MMVSSTNLILIHWNIDAVIRTVYYKYFHPKEVHVMNGVLNRELNRAAGKRDVHADTPKNIRVKPTLDELAATLVITVQKRLINDVDP